MNQNASTADPTPNAMSKLWLVIGSPIWNAARRRRVTAPSLDRVDRLSQFSPARGTFNPFPVRGLSSRLGPASSGLPSDGAERRLPSDRGDGRARPCDPG